MKVLNFGSLNIDNIYRVDGLVEDGYTIHDKHYQVLPGGKGLNQSVALKKAGIKHVYHAGNIGAQGELLLFALLEYGIHTDYVIRSEQKTGHAVIQIADNAGHGIIVHGGSNYHITTSFVDEVLANFSRGDYLLLQNEIANIPYIIHQAYEKGMEIILNPAPFDKSVLTYDLSKVSHLIVNEDEFVKMAGKETTPESFQQTHGFELLLTQGKKGGILIDKIGSRYSYDAYQVEEKDTTSIGDAFVGYYMAGVICQWPIDKRLSVASKAAALTATQFGSANAIPSVDQVMTFEGAILR